MNTTASTRSNVSRPGFFLIILILSAVGISNLTAERMDGLRSEATYALTGEVMHIYVSSTEKYLHYIVELEIGSVERGKGIQAGERFYVYSFKRKVGAPLEEFARGHKDHPKVGETIRAFVNRADGKNEAVYPDWWEASKPSAE